MLGKMAWRIYERNIVFYFLIVSFAMCQVCPMQVTCPDELHATTGSSLPLRCSFYSTSRPSSRTSVEWSFRPQSGGPTQSIFHFDSEAYPLTEGHFKGRLRWAGGLNRGDASIQLLNASLGDNGTYTCVVRNPPDVHGFPGQIKLTVTPSEPEFRFTDVAVLMGLTLLPAALVVLVLLGHMCCPCSPQWDQIQTQNYHSPIEVIEGEELGYKKPCVKEKCGSCCHLYLQDSDYEEYTLEEKLHKHPIAESHC